MSSSESKTRERLLDFSDDDRLHATDPWSWKRCRDFGIEFGFWPLVWRAGFERWSDAFAWVGTLNFGPFVFAVNFNMGQNPDLSKAREAQ